MNFAGPRAICAILAMGASGSCAPLPIPQTVLIRPEIQGEVRLNGLPANDVKISIAHDFSGASCLPGQHSVRSDSAGRFGFTKEAHFKPFTIVPLLPYHKFYRFALCFESDGVGRTLFAATDFTSYSLGLGPIPDRFVLDCELSPQSPIVHAPKQAGLCSDRTLRSTRKGGRSKA